MLLLHHSWLKSLSPLYKLFLSRFSVNFAQAPAHLDFLLALRDNKRVSINPEELPNHPTESASAASSASAPQSAEPEVKPQITEKQAARINAPARNMIISMLVMIALLVPFLLLAPQLTNSQNHYDPNVDLHGTAYNASQEAKYPVAAPEPEGWTYNFARWTTAQADKIDVWSTGMVTPSQKYIELMQAKGTNPTWIANKVENAAISGEKEINGTTWEIRTLEDPKEDKTTTSYIAEVNGTTVILKGEAEPAEFEQLASAVVDYSKNPTMTTEPTASSGIK